MMKNVEMVHRDLNWCDFNARVLAEAHDPAAPLIDRIKFLAIFSSNLDEFFRVKVAALRKLQVLKKEKATKWLGYSPAELLHNIYEKVFTQQEEFGRIWREEIFPQLKQANIHLYQSTDVLPEHRKEIKEYFRVHVQGFLQLIIARKSSKVELNNRAIYIVSELKSEKHDAIGFVAIPSIQIDRYKQLSSVNGTHYFISLDDIIRINLPHLFVGYDVQGESFSIKLNRDEDYEIEDEFSGNLVDKITEKISKRMERDPVRFLFDATMPKSLLEKIIACCNVPGNGTAGSHS